MVSVSLGPHDNKPRANVRLARLGALACLLALAAYGLAMRRRGGSWPVHRALLWAAGVVSVAAVTCTGVNSYGM